MASPNYQGALFIIRMLKALQHEALLAGGCVRDRLLGLEPKDFDIATSATPTQVQEAFPKTEAVGAAFGVVLVIHEGAAYEVATFRSDGAYADGRRPEAVKFSSPEEDAQRRDFTVNGMFFDPNQDEVMDLVGGQADLKRKLIRAIGDPKSRFEEDRLRVLRAIRFACQLGFEIEEKTWAALKEFSAQMGPLAMERVAAELTRMFSSPQPRRAVELLDESGLLEALLPELLPCKGCAQPPEFHPEGDVWVHTLMAMEALKNPSPRLGWATLLHDIGKPATFSQEPGDRIRFNRHEEVGAEMAARACDRFKLSNDLKDGIVTLVADHLRLNPVKDMKLATLKRLLRREDFEDLLELHRVDCVASHNGMELYEFAKAKKAEFEASESQASLRPEPLLDGADLISLGYKPGPLFKEALQAVEDEQLEGRIQDKDAALHYVKNRWKP